MIHLALLIVAWYVIGSVAIFLLRIIGAILGAGYKIWEIKATEANHRETRAYLDRINTGGSHPDWDYARCQTDPAYAAYVESYMARQTLQETELPDFR